MKKESNMKKRIIRILIYEGEQSFLDASLNHRGVVGKKETSTGSITEYFFTRVPMSEEIENADE